LTGFDSSPAMVAEARRRLASRPGAEARVADVTAPLPGAPVDLLHARYLLAHLAEPAAVVDRWGAQLRPGGRLLLDEIDHIDVTVEAFRRYLDLVRAMLADHGTDLFAGRVLGGHRPAGAVRVVGEQPVRLPQPTA